MLLPAYRSVQDMFLSCSFSQRSGWAAPITTATSSVPHPEPLREAKRGPEIYAAKTGVRDKVISVSLFTAKGASLEMVMPLAADCFSNEPADSGWVVSTAGSQL